MSEYRVTITRSELANLDYLCHGIITRNGIEDACHKAATTVLWDPESAHIWPACTWHANRNGGAVHLANIRDAWQAGASEFVREVADDA